MLEGKNNIYLISGPTNVQQPTFSWDNTTCENHYPGRYYHEGTPQTWNFPWIDYKFQLVNIKFDDDEHDDGSNIQKWIIIASCILGAIILLIVIFIIIKKCIRNKSSTDIDTNNKDEEMNVRLTD